MEQASAATGAAVRRRSGGRSARVRAQVLRATLEIIGEAGAAGLTFEAVARRAGVNRTTVWRRWPTLAGLVAEAVADAQDTAIPVPDTGMLGSDLLELLIAARALLQSATGQALVNAAFALPAGAAMAQLHQAIWAARFARLEPVIERAIARGELAPDARPRRVLERMIAPLYFRVLVTREPVEDDDLVDWVADAILPDLPDLPDLPEPDPVGIAAGRAVDPPRVPGALDPPAGVPPSSKRGARAQSARKGGAVQP